jgi:hypothetical protein
MIEEVGDVVKCACILIRELLNALAYVPYALCIYSFPIVYALLTILLDLIEHVIYKSLLLAYEHEKTQGG